VAPTAVVPPTGSLSANTNSIERGQSVTLTWQVNNASSVSISEIGSVAPQGSRTVNPGKTTTYNLTANGSTLLAEQTVDVHEPRQQAQVVTQPVITAPARPAGPDAAALIPSLNAYKSLVSGSPGKSKKDCQGDFNGAYQGKLHGFAAWCGVARSIDVSEQCSQVGGSPDAPTLSCAETLIIRPKDGDPQASHSQKTFHFAKGSDGSWQLSGW
jgi:hypothetical protein